MKKQSLVLFLFSYLRVISSQTEDFAFDQDNSVAPTLAPLKRLWGIPDSKSHVGKYVQVAVPGDAFEGVVSKYEASGAGGKSLPSWLRLDSSTGTLEGVPGEEDIGEVYIAMVAVGQQQKHSVKDYFAIEVLPHTYSHQVLLKDGCPPGEDVSTITVVLDKEYSSLSADSKISILTNLAGYLGMPRDRLSLIPHKVEDMLTDSAISAGPGNVKRKTSTQSTVVQWQIGCSGKVLPKYSTQVQQIKHDAYDGTLAEVLQLPIVGWHLSVSSTGPPFRHRRQIFGSGDSENDTEDLDLDEDNLDNLPEVSGKNSLDEATPEPRIIPIAASPVFSEPSTSVVPSEVHPHRHHHGEVESAEPTYTSLLTSPVPFATIMPTPTYDPERPTAFSTVLVTPSQALEEFSVAPTPAISLVEPSVTPEMSTPQETVPLVVESSSEHSSTEALTTSPPPTESTPRATTPQLVPENTAPIINRKLPRQATTAGKPFRYVIPDTVFSDLEDGNTRKLHLTLKTQEGSPLKYSWIHFNPENQEVIALPLEEHVSKWSFTLEARDSEGLVVNDTLELSVQHHKGRRTVTHALTLDLALQSTPTPVEWQLQLVDRLAALYGDSDSDKIIVLILNICTGDSCPDTGPGTAEHNYTSGVAATASRQTGSTVTHALTLDLALQSTPTPVEWQLQLVTHALTLDLALQSTPTPEWQLQLVDRLAALYGDSDTDKIIVLILYICTGDSCPDTGPGTAEHNYTSGVAATASRQTGSTVTHALTLDLALQSTPTPVEWQLQLVDRLAALYGDSDSDKIIVLILNICTGDSCPDTGPGTAEHTYTSGVAATASRQTGSTVTHALTLDLALQSSPTPVEWQLQLVDRLAALYGDSDSDKIIVLILNICTGDSCPDIGPGTAELTYTSGVAATASRQTGSTVTHALTLDLALQSTPTPVEWQLQLVDRLAALYGDSDSDKIIVLILNICTGDSCPDIGPGTAELTYTSGVAATASRQTGSTVTHALTLDLALQSTPTPVEWQLQLVDRLAALYGDSDSDKIIVLILNICTGDSCPDTGPGTAEHTYTSGVAATASRQTGSTVTHALTLDLALQSTPTPVEWQLQLVDRLAALYGDSDSDKIIVLGVTPQDDPITFTWTNDSLPRNHCPREQIDNLLKVLRANEDGKPTDAVRHLLSPQITVVRVSWTGKGTCDSPPSPPEKLPPSTQNFSPTIRNQVDIINATLGQLLVYTVPEDTFYDPEDGSTRNMELSVLHMDRSPLNPTHWLQFDTKNQEFYGIPMSGSDVGKQEYQLVCKDSGGLTAYDGLVVVVQPPAKVLYNVEFSMDIDIDYDNFASNPAMKRHFVERLAELFGDRNSSAIVFSGVTDNPTHIVWHNRSLPTEYCPHEQIQQLRQILLVDESRLSNQVNTVLGPEFPVVKASLIPTARCQGALTETHPIEPVYPSGDVRPVSRSHEEYLITVVVPAVVIAAMLLCAGLVACVLYRRHRTGKMSVGSEDERQSFRSKGIPVIFQDELEERPEPANKSPVIMKEEKPPLPPPEYHQRTALLSDTEAYQPPPPFPLSRDSGRPKPTPTYRKPPPYVPP
ncbi:uncharacterized protein LOC128997581 [Macrosteles quadrilineatus]|uniref:uncharacterized protein LOC128997581 n=1 Tax=Macrosteles quadrilineatus TaxID=74068 RepID=UPI0023E16B7D|nr:uncharacterized protein LOC128997581 [Macrosteles quadrilineatus]